MHKFVITLRGNVAFFGGAVCASLVAWLLVFGARGEEVKAKKEIKLHVFGFNNNGILI